MQGSDRAVAGRDKFTRQSREKRERLGHLILAAVSPWVVWGLADKLKCRCPLLSALTLRFKH